MSARVARCSSIRLGGTTFVMAITATQHMEVPIYVSVPTSPIRGNRKQRRKAVKELWIAQLGGRCSSCFVTYSCKGRTVRTRDRECYERQTSNLEAHYLGSDRETHKLYTLGKLEVPPETDFGTATVFRGLHKTSLPMCPPMQGVPRGHTWQGVRSVATAGGVSIHVKCPVAPANG